MRKTSFDVLRGYRGSRLAAKTHPPHGGAAAPSSEFAAHSDVKVIFTPSVPDVFFIDKTISQPFSTNTERFPFFHPGA